MPLPTPAGCTDWPIEWGGDVSGVETDIRDDAHAAAARVLWSLSGRRYGVCEVVRGPVPGYPSGCVPPHAQTPDAPSLWLDGEDPTVIDVYEAETVINQADWAQAGRWLIRVADGSWPVNTWADPTALMVHMNIGLAPPAGAAQAVGELAYELVKAVTGDECQLPARVQMLTRQGVTVQMIDTLDFLTNGRVGLALCDQFIASVNRHSLDGASRVLSPDKTRWRNA